MKANDCAEMQKLVDTVLNDPKQSMLDNSDQNYKTLKKFFLKAGKKFGFEWDPVKNKVVATKKD